MKSYIAIALILCLAVMQVQSQGAQQKSTGSPQNARAAAAVARAANLAMLSGAAKNAAGNRMGGVMGRGLWPLMMSQGNDMLQNYFLFRMLSGSSSGSGSQSSSSSTMGGLEPLIYGSMMGGFELL